MTRQLIIFFTLLFFLVSCKKDVEIFDNYNFDSGEYKLYACLDEGTPTEFVSKTDDFIITDTKTLKEIKNIWKLHLTNDRWACGTNYSLYLMKEDTCVDLLQINMECEFLMCNKGYFFFPKNLLTIHENSLVKFSRDSAKVFRENIKIKQLFRKGIFK